MNRYTRHHRTGNGGFGSGGFASGMLMVGLLFVAAAAGLIWVGMGIVASDRWPIRWLQVDGSFQRVSAEQLRASLASRIDNNFFTVDMRGLRDSAASLSWVESVKVQKQWPDTIRVVVKEYEPVAHWNQGELISDEGRTFAVPEADELQGLPWLEGPEGRLDDVLRIWVDFSDLLVPLGLEVNRLKLDRRGSWSMVLSNGTRVELGRDAAESRLRRLLVSWDELMRERRAPPQDVDLRYTNGFAVLWPQPPSSERGAGS
ncbi:MAG: cell division protein FtsQ/DivIB [Lysobacterales bacterium]